MQKKAAVIPASGLGDGLIMLTTCQNLLNLGYKVTIFHSPVQSFKNCINNKDLFFKPFLKNINNLLFFDWVILQNDNSKKVEDIIDLRNKKLYLTVFYPTFKNLLKHKKTIYDHVFNSSISMIDNIILFFKKFLQNPSKKINFTLPKTLIKKQTLENKILIHPTSKNKNKNWSFKKYIKLYQKIEKIGFSPIFIMNQEEKNLYFPQKNSLFNIKTFSTPLDLAKYILENSYFLIGNDSGPVHLASFLNTAFIIIANDKKRMQLWQPGWKKAAKIILPPPYLPNIKGVRLKTQGWQHFISVRKVFKELKNLILTN